jgi:hypothetical protein
LAALPHRAATPERIHISPDHRKQRADRNTQVNRDDQANTNQEFASAEPQTAGVGVNVATATKKAVKQASAAALGRGLLFRLDLLVQLVPA